MENILCTCGYYTIGYVCTKCGRIYNEDGEEVHEIESYDYRAGLDFEPHNWDSDDRGEMV